MVAVTDTNDALTPDQHSRELRNRAGNQLKRDAVRR